MTSLSPHSEFAARLQARLPVPASASFDPGARSPSWSEEEFEALALDLFRIQFESVAPYRAFCLARDSAPRNVHSWREIPAIPAAAFKEFEVTSLPPAQRARWFRSSGTTQEIPSRHFHDLESLELYERSVWPWFHRHLLEELESFQLLVLTPPPAAAPESSLVHMFETVRRNLGESGAGFTGRIAASGVWEIESDATWRRLQSSVDQAKPVVLLGTAIGFLDLLDALEKRDLKFALPPGSRILETGGYKSRSRTMEKRELYRALETRLGVPELNIVSEYGMTELSSQAYDHKTGVAPAQPRWFRFPPWARLRIVSPETGRELPDGECGLIQVFDLANVRSVLAMQTSDLARNHADGFELLGRAPQAEARGCSLSSQ